MDFVRFSSVVQCFYLVSATNDQYYRNDGDNDGRLAKIYGYIGLRGIGRELDVRGIKVNGGEIMMSRKSKDGRSISEPETNNWTPDISSDSESVSRSSSQSESDSSRVSESDSSSESDSDSSSESESDSSSESESDISSESESDSSSESESDSSSKSESDSTGESESYSSSESDSDNSTESESDSSNESESDASSEFDSSSELGVAGKQILFALANRGALRRDEVKTFEAGFTS